MVAKRCLFASHDSMITIARYSWPHEAQIARAKLESEGVPVFVADEHTVSVNWLLSGAVGGIRVQVPEEHAARAVEILQRDDSEAVEALAEDPEEEWEEPEPRCPACGGALAMHTPGRRPAFLSWLFLGFPIGSVRRKLCCTNCGWEGSAQRR